MSISRLFQRISQAAEGRPLLTVAVLTGLGALVALGLRLQGPPPTALALTPVVESVLRDAGSPRAGAADADVVVVVFTDYRCPVCRRTDGALERLLASDARVRVHFKDWPILGEASRLGARAALAAERQGKYLALHRALMEDPAPLTAERLPDVARTAGLDAERLARDMAEHGRDIDEQLSRHAAQAFALGLRGTPAYLVGPHLIEGGLDDGKLTRAVAKARRAGPPRPPGQIAPR